MGQYYDKIQKKCIVTCNPDSEIYNPKTNKCRPLCTGTTVWSDSLDTCKDCGKGDKWNEQTLSCNKYCSTDGDCNKDQYCVNNSCCEYPVCKTKDGDKCCNDCSPDPNNQGYSVCCSKLQTCNVNGKTICCQGGQICNKDNKCVDPCGPDGSTVVCSDGQKCLQIKDVNNNSNMYKKLSSNTNNYSEQNKDGTTNFYSCLDINDVCQSDTVHAVPPAINNFYPCFEIDKKNKDTGLGFCSYKTDVTKVNDCKNFEDEKTCTSQDCKWYNILEYDTDDYSELNKVITNTFRTYDGYYCGNNDENKSRLYGLKLDTKKCSYENCVAAVANPTVTDIYYDESTGNCTSLQSCVSTGNLKTSVINKSLQQLIPNCNNSDTSKICNDLKIDQRLCDSDGLIKPFGSNCLEPGKIGVTADGTCICTKGYTGNICQYSRNDTCNNHGEPNNTGSCTCDELYIMKQGTGCVSMLWSDYYTQDFITKLFIPFAPDLQYWNELITIIVTNKNSHYEFKYWSPDPYEKSSRPFTANIILPECKSPDSWCYSKGVIGEKDGEDPNDLNSFWMYGSGGTNESNQVGIFINDNPIIVGWGANAKDTIFIKKPPYPEGSYKLYPSGTVYVGGPAVLIIAAYPTMDESGNPYPWVGYG